MYIWAGLPPVPQKLVQCIQAGEYVDVSELLPGRLGINAGPPVTNILEWLQCYSIYIYGRKGAPTRCKICWATKPWSWKQGWNTREMGGWATTVTSDRLWPPPPIHPGPKSNQLDGIKPSLIPGSWFRAYGMKYMVAWRGKFTVHWPFFGTSFCQANEGPSKYHPPCFNNQINKRGM